MNKRPRQLPPKRSSNRELARARARRKVRNKPNPQLRPTTPKRIELEDPLSVRDIGARHRRFLVRRRFGRRARAFSWGNLRLRRFGRTRRLVRHRSCRSGSGCLLCGDTFFTPRLTVPTGLVRFRPRRRRGRTRLALVALRLLSFRFLVLRFLSLGPLGFCRRGSITGSTDDISRERRRLLAAGRVMLPQEQRKRPTVPSSGKPAGRLVANRAIIREQFRRRFAPIDIGLRSRPRHHDERRCQAESDYPRETPNHAEPPKPPRLRDHTYPKSRPM